jgi:pseudouridine-5'-phosphate glycosidase
MHANLPLDILPEIAVALESNQPVVALESTIITHGMDYPTNLETALLVEKTIHETGALPATIAIINGRIKVGLSKDQIEWVAKNKT